MRRETRQTHLLLRCARSGGCGGRGARERRRQGDAEGLGHDGSDEGISTYAYFTPQTGAASLTRGSTSSCFMKKPSG